MSAFTNRKKKVRRKATKNPESPSPGNQENKKKSEQGINSQLLSYKSS